MFPTKVEISGNVTHTIEDADLDAEIKRLEERLGLAAQIDGTAALRDVEAGTSPTNGEAKTADLLPANGSATS